MKPETLCVFPSEGYLYPGFRAIAGSKLIDQTEFNMLFQSLPRKLLGVVLIVLFSFSFLFVAKSQEIPPKRELRGVWVATVSNIDFPASPVRSADALRSEWEEKLDELAGAGFNAVFVQVRPAADAFYPSGLAPWSRYLTGKQGRPIEEDFDPMKMMIDETRERGMAFHAWLNPYRASMDTLLNQLSEEHPLKQHPEWMVKYGGRLYLNPALPEVRNYVTEVVLELLMKYRLDGIHFDDYFYPYPAGEPFPDAEDFVRYGYGYPTIDAWRRSNVDKLIAQVSGMIKAIAPEVQFGVSPFGVFRNKAVDPLLGSDTRAAVTTYDDLHADVLHWLKNGWVDYIAPQLYWNIGYEPADYKVLVAWWQAHREGRPVFAGMAAYKVGNNAEPAWHSPKEIPGQIRLNRSLPGVGGCVFYNAKSVLSNPLGMLDSLRNNYFRTTALPPEMPWMDLSEPPVPKLEKPKWKKDTLHIKVKIAKPEIASQVVVYRFEDRLPGDYFNPENIYRVIRVPENGICHFTDTGIEAGKYYTYAVSAMNHQNTESILSNAQTVLLKGKRLKVIKQK